MPYFLEMLFSVLIIKASPISMFLKLKVNLCSRLSNFRFIRCREYSAYKVSLVHVALKLPT